MNPHAIAAVAHMEYTDGDATLEGVVSLTRDMRYRDLTLADGTNIHLNGFRIAARSITCLGDWIIHNEPPPEA